MKTYWERWKDSGGAEWREAFESVEPILEMFARDQGLRITRWHWDEPDITLSWADARGIHRSLRLLLDPESYMFQTSGAAWRDDPWEGPTGTRRWKTQVFDDLAIKVPLPPSLGERQRSVISVLLRAYTVVSSWREADLEDVSALSDTAAKLLRGEVKP